MSEYIRPPVAWLTYYTDFSGMAVFDNEIDALRHAVEHHMECRPLTNGQEFGPGHD